jgi:putative membrane protein
MQSLALRAGLALGLNAAALAIAAAVLDRMTIGTVTFVVAVVIFTLVSLVVPSITRSTVRRYASPIGWGAGLIGTYIALLLTDLVSDGLQIEGLGTWILATVIVWGAGVLLDSLFRSRGRPTAQPATR